MQDHLAAAIIGSLASSLRQTRRGFSKLVQSFSAGFLFSYYVSMDIIELMSTHFDIALSYGAAYFLAAFFGAEILDRISSVIQTLRLNNDH